MDGQITNEHGQQGQYENGIKHGGPESKFWNVKAKIKTTHFRGQKCTLVFFYLLSPAHGVKGVT